MKKGSLIGLFGLLIVGLFVFMSFVSAQANPLSNVFSDFKQSLDPFFDKLFSNEGGLALKVLFFFLVFLIVSSILPFVPLFGKDANGKDRPFIRFLVSVTVTILSTMFIPANLLSLMVNPYTALGAVIISVLPFILLFVFTHKTISNRFIQRALWLMYAIILLGLYLNSLVNGPLDAGADPKGNTIFTWTYGIATLVAFIMLIANQWIEEKLWRAAVEKGNDEANKYLDERRLQIKYDKQRAEVELGIESKK